MKLAEWGGIGDDPRPGPGNHDMDEPKTIEPDRADPPAAPEAEPRHRFRFKPDTPERRAAAEAWRRENAEAIRLSNEQLERDGLWCDDYRMF